MIMWWITAEDHRFALEVLQLRLRREILSFMGCKMKTVGEIEGEFGLSSFQAEYHLTMLIKALVIEKKDGHYRASPTGILFLETQKP
jgi:predicted transcriptional regulator